MRKLILLLPLSLLLAACGNSVTITHGTVVDKFYQPEKDWDDWEYSPQCGMGFDGQYTCGKLKLQNVHHHQDEAHRLRVENCRVLDKNGNTLVNKDGTSKCFYRWFDVDEHTFYHVKKGTDYTPSEST